MILSVFLLNIHRNTDTSLEELQTVMETLAHGSAKSCSRISVTL